MLKVTEVDNKKYSEFESQLSNTTFLQNPSWVTFKEQTSNYIAKYYLVLNDDSPIGVFSTLVRKIMGIEAIYIPRTNIFFKEEDNKYLEDVLNYLKRSSLVIFERDISLNDNSKVLNSGFKLTDKYIQPLTTFVTDTTVINPEMLSMPSSSQRRNIRKALKNMEDLGITFEFVETLDDTLLNECYSLIRGLGGSKEYGVREISYFRNISKVKGSGWFIIKDRSSKVLMCNLVVIDRHISTCFDLVVGKSKEVDELMLHYAMKYLSFKWCKENGITKYDHWGIFKNISSKASFSEFKMKFGGYEVNYPKLTIYTKFPFSLVTPLILSRI